MFPSCYVADACWSRCSIRNGVACRRTRRASQHRSGALGLGARQQRARRPPLHATSVARGPRRGGAAVAGERKRVPGHV